MIALSCRLFFPDNLWFKCWALIINWCCYLTLECQAVVSICVGEADRDREREREGLLEMYRSLAPPSSADGTSEGDRLTLLLLLRLLLRLWLRLRLRGEPDFDRDLPRPPPRLDTLCLSSIASMRALFRGGRFSVSSKTSRLGSRGRMISHTRSS
jgi:hypothetical protein